MQLRCQTLLRAREVSERLGISVSFTKKLIRERRVKSVRIGTSVRVPLAEVERVEREGCDTGTAA